MYNYIHAFIIACINIKYITYKQKSNNIIFFEHVRFKMLRAEEKYLTIKVYGYERKNIYLISGKLDLENDAKIQQKIRGELSIK